MANKWIWGVPVLIMLSLTAACTPAGDWWAALTVSPVVEAAGDPEWGEQLFRVGVGDATPCSACHQVGVAGMGFSLGPNLAGVAVDAAVRVEGLTAEEYLVESILQPENYIVPGYRVSMFDDYAAHLSRQNIADITAYLLTLSDAP